MYVTDILDAYNDQLDMVDFDQLMSEGERLGEEIKRGFEVYENLIIVERYRRAHGMTKDLKELIGNEGLLSSVGSALAKFGKWIVQKLKDLFHFIVALITSVFVNVIALFTTAFSMLKTCKAPYNLPEIEKGIMNLFGPFADKQVNVDSRLGFQDSAEANIAHYKAVSKAIIDKLREVLTPDPNQKFSYKRQEIYRHADRIGDILDDHRNQCQRTAKRIEQLTSLIERAGDSFGTDDMVVKNAITMLDQSFSDVDFTGTYGYKLDSGLNIRKLFSTKMQLIQIGITHFGTMGKCVISYLKELRKIYDNTSFAIHMEIPYDKGLAERLRAFYGGGTFTPGYIIITNTSPATWPSPLEASNPWKSSGVCGWCHNFERDHTKPDLFINLSALRSRIMRIFSLGDTNGAWRRESWFLKVIVHESRHLYDMQNNIPFDEQHFGDGYRKYRKYQHEQRAFGAEKTYKLTKEDLVWARNVLDQVDKEIEKQKHDKEVAEKSNR